MTPSKLDLVITRGTDFEIEIVGQTKNYIFDPDVHTDPADLKRTHAENLEFYGFNYGYIDFLTDYSAAELIVSKPWRQQGDELRDNLLELSLAAGDIELTAKSVKIGIPAANTQELDFDSGKYRLILTTAAGKVDTLIQGNVEVNGER